MIIVDFSPRAGEPDLHECQSVTAAMALIRQRFPHAVRSVRWRPSPFFLPACGPLWLMASQSVWADTRSMELDSDSTPEHEIALIVNCDHAKPEPNAELWVEDEIVEPGESPNR